MDTEAINSGRPWGPLGIGIPMAHSGIKLPIGEASGDCIAQEVQSGMAVDTFVKRRSGVAMEVFHVADAVYFEIGEGIIGSDLEPAAIKHFCGGRLIGSADQFDRQTHRRGKQIGEGWLGWSG